MASPDYKDKRKKTGRAEHHRHGFDHFTADILECQLDTSLVDYLVSICVLTVEDADTIRQRSGQTNRNKCLINILRERPYNSYNSFIEALKTTDVMDIDIVRKMELFQVKGVNPNFEFADPSIDIHDFTVKFQKNYKTLVDQITSPVQLANTLLELKTFNREDREDINSETVVSRKNRKLLSKVSHKGKSGNVLFLKVLKNSDDIRDQELAIQIENTDISENDKLLLQIGITILHENEDIPPDVKEAATKKEDHWEEEDEVFVETRSTTRIYNMINENNVITIVGSSGSGKTAAMRHVVLKLKYEKRFRIIHVDSPNKIVEYRKKNSRQVFLVDDVLGKYAVSPILVEQWERCDSEIQHCLNMKPGNMKLLFTIRKQSANNTKFSTCSSVITTNIVDLEDDQNSLLKAEKMQILTEHLKRNNMEDRVTEKDIQEVCDLTYAFPLICRIVSSNDERRNNITRFFRDSSSLLEIELQQLWTRNKEVYCSLVVCMLFNGQIGKDIFDINLPRHKKLNIAAEACGLSADISRQVIADSLTTLVGTYVSFENNTFYFMHDAFFECISSHFAKQKPDVMFSHCGIDLIRDRVRIDSKLPSDDENVIVIGQDQYEVIAKRILTECEEGRFSNVLLSNVIKNQQFVEYFGEQLKMNKQTTLHSLMFKVSNEGRNHKLKDLVLEMWRSFKQADHNENILDDNNAGIKEVIRAPSRQSTFTHWKLASGCNTLFHYIWQNASKREQNKLLSRDVIFIYTKPFFPLAVLGGNIDIIKTLHSSGADVNGFSCDGETPLSVTCKNGRADIATDIVNWGADANRPDMLSHKLPSFICEENENVEVLELLLNNHCDVNFVDIFGRRSTMLQAMLTRKIKIVNLLLKFHSKDHPLHEAILNSDISCVRSHLRKEYINSQTHNKLTPLHFATQVQDKCMMETLLGDHGDQVLACTAGRCQGSNLQHSIVANINSKNKNGLNPLHLAVLNDNIEAVNFLLQRNADRNANDHFGRIPLHYSQHPAISFLLLNVDNSKSIVSYLPDQFCSVVPGKKSDLVVVDIDGNHKNQMDISLFSAFRVLVWFLYPFKR